MNWIVFAFGAAFFWSLNIVFDKYVVDHEIEDYVVTTIFCSFSAFILVGAASIFKGASVAELSLSHLSLGVLYTLALMAYYSGIGREEVSRFAPTLAVDTLFILLFSFIFLGEGFGIIVYLAVGAVVLGAFLISLDDPVHSLKEFESKKGFYLAITAALVFATRDVLFKFSLGDTSYWTVLLGMSVGGIISVLILVLYKSKKIKESSDKGFEHLLGIGVLMALGYLSFVAAINNGPVSLSSAIVKSQNLMIFGITVALQKFHPGVVDEEMERPILIQKLLAIFLIVIGLVVIQLY
jgi:uncharacterized membrane protein